MRHSQDNQDTMAEAPAPARRSRKRMAFAIGVPVALAGIVVASAASLGGITGGTLGADTDVVASCDTNGVTVGYVNSYDATDGRYETTAVNATAIDVACDTKPIKVTLKDGAGASLGEATGTVATNAATLNFAAGIDSEAVEGIAIIIAD